MLMLQHFHFRFAMFFFVFSSKHLNLNLVVFFNYVNFYLYFLHRHRFGYFTDNFNTALVMGAKKLILIVDVDCVRVHMSFACTRIF